MEHLSCDLCGQGLLLDSAVRYEVKIEIKAAYDPLELTDDDLKKDYKRELAAVLRKLEGLSSEEAQNQIYRAFHFDLCAACQKRYLKNPLPRS